MSVFSCPLRRDANERAGDRALSYGFTTNATLITDEVARFLAANRFRLLVSLDGPQHVHDRHRRAASGGGTFDRVLAGLRRLRDQEPEYYERVRFNCVLARHTKLEEVFEFFATNELVRGHEVLYSAAVPHYPWGTEEYGALTEEQRGYLHTGFVAAAAKGSQTSSGVARAYAKLLEFIALRDRAPLSTAVHPNGCCVPFLRKMVVRANGDVHICEQEPNTNCLGNVNTRFDFETAVALVREYAANSLPDCQRCWAMRLCSACYRHFMNACRWEGVHRSAQCEARRERLLHSLAEYAAILEQCPTAFDYLKEFTFTFPV